MIFRYIAWLPIFVVYLGVAVFANVAIVIVGLLFLLLATIRPKGFIVRPPRRGKADEGPAE